MKLSYNVPVEAMSEFVWNKYWDCLRIFSLKQWGYSAETSFESVLQYFRGGDEEIRLRCVLNFSYNVFVEAMSECGWDKYWDCLRTFSLKRWGYSAETSFESVWQYFRWSDEEIRLRRVLKLSYNVFVGRWGNLAETSFEIVLECFRWSDEEIRLRQVSKLSDSFFVEAMRKLRWDGFWNFLTMVSLKRWGNLAETNIENVGENFRWSDEEIRLKQVLKVSDKIFVEAMRIFGWDEFWNCLTIISLKWWRNRAKTCFEIVLQCFCWSDERMRVRQVLRLSKNFFVEAMRMFGWNKFWKCLTIFSWRWWRNPAKMCFEIFLQCLRWSDERMRLRQVLRLS